jgi:hypothetical protein
MRALRHSSPVRRALAALVPLALLSLLCLALVAPAGAQAPVAVCPPASAAPQATPPAPAGTPATPEQVVACVGSQSINQASFLHWSAILAKSTGRPSAPNGASGEGLTAVMGFLISSDWVIDEAQARGIVVSAAAVRRSFDRTRDQQFPRRREFKAFLRRSGQTVADLMLRVRLNLLSARIQHDVEAGLRSAHARHQALSRFVHEFKARWTAQTYCAPAYAMADCGHVQAAL